MMILQTTTDSDPVKDIDTKAAEIDFLPPLSFVILHSVCGSVTLFYELQGYPLSVGIYAKYPDIDILVQFQHF